MTTNGIKGEASEGGDLLLRQVYFLSGSSLELTRADLSISRKDGQVKILKAGEDGLREHFRTWVLEGKEHARYLVLPAFTNWVDFGVLEQLHDAGFYSEEEKKQGQIQHLHQIVEEVLKESLKSGASNVNISHPPSLPAEQRETLTRALRDSGLRGNVVSSEAELRGLAGEREILCFRQKVLLGEPLPDLADMSKFLLGTGNVILCSPNIWEEFKAIVYHLMSQNKGKLPLRAEDILRQTFYGGGKLNIIQDGYFPDLTILRLHSNQDPVQVLSLLFQGDRSMVQGVIRRGKFLSISDELNGAIHPYVSTKKEAGDCEFDSVEDALVEIAKGNFVVVVDNEDRENEGDLIMSCEAVTEEKMAFMIRHTSGLICISATAERLKELELPLMVQANNESFTTAFTVSIDYKHGTTTGISAYDRALTARAVANPKVVPGDFNRPGHMFPLRYSKGGVITRMGHTEATVDLCKMAGVYPAGILCEIALDNGKMARRDYLRSFATEHKLKMITIADMIEYRKKNNLLDLFESQ